MTTHEERQRLAAMGNALRPDWPTRSLYTLLTDDEVLVNRAYRDLAKAAAHCWTDPQTKTPKRLSEPGPWWSTPTTTHPAGKQPIAIVQRCNDCGGLHPPDPTGALCNPPEHQRSHGRGATAARAALHATKDTP